MINTIRGWIGEQMTTFGMWISLDTKVYRRFHNVIVPSSDGTTQIDHVLVSPYGVFVIETKNIKGWIFGSANQKKWTQSLFGKKFSFQNPLHQNYRHVQCLAEYLGLDKSKLHSVVFFIGECTFKTDLPPNVMRSGLKSYVHRFQDPVLSNPELDRIVSVIQGIKNNKTLNHKYHMNSLRERHATKDSDLCPKCGSYLAERTAKKGNRAGSKFLGCKGFPKCRYTKNL